MNQNHTQTPRATDFQQMMAKLVIEKVGGKWTFENVLAATEELRRTLDLGSPRLQAAICGESDVVVIIDGGVLTRHATIEEHCPNASADDAGVHDQVEAQEHARRYRADTFLTAGLGHMQDRAAEYDSPEGERSMEAAVEAFNAITGCDLTEAEGWTFMQVLKLVRANQGGPFNPDHYQDLAAYAGLHGEGAARQHRRLHHGEQAA